MITPTLIRSIVIGICGLIFALVMIVAVQNGYRRAQSNIIYQNTGEIAAALEYFKEDNNRYPTATEFVDQNGFGRYLVGGNPRQLISGDCADTYDYTLNSPLRYTFAICLPAAVAGLPAGSHQITP